MLLLAFAFVVESSINVAFVGLLAVVLNPIRDLQILLDVGSLAIAGLAKMGIKGECVGIRLEE